MGTVDLVHKQRMNKTHSLMPPQRVNLVIFFIYMDINSIWFNSVNEHCDRSAHFECFCWELYYWSSR